MTNSPTETNEPDFYDAVVVGTGFGGLYMLHRLKNDLGLSVLGIERGDDVGGTWNWNRYPGAKSDTWSHVYRYSFNQELLNDTALNRWYATQPEIFNYFKHVVETLALGPDLRFGVNVLGAEFDEDTNIWTVATDTLGEIRTKYFVTAVGVLSAPHCPDLPGIDEFAGQIHHTSRWPEGAQLAGRRVGVVGTGSTGIQVITAIASEVANLTVFQRTPQYVVPAGDKPYTAEEAETIVAKYADIWTGVRNSFAAFDFPETHLGASEVDSGEVERVLERAWNGGNGFRFMFGTFGDLAIDPVSNEAAASFIRTKIAGIVKDPEVRRKLTPTGPYTRRPACADGYYEIYNRPNVNLVSLRETPIARFTPRGVVTSDGTEHELDVLVFATGFDAFEANLVKLDIRGRGGVSLRDSWTEAPSSYLGVATADFPNMFMVFGPLAPFTNNVPAIEAMVDHITDVVEQAQRQGAATVDVAQSAETEWHATCAEIADVSLMSKDESSWIFGGNIPGKRRGVRIYLGGLAAYREVTAAEAATGFPSYSMKLPNNH